MDNAYSGIAYHKKTKASRSFDSTKMRGNIKGEEMRLANLKNPRPIANLSQSMRKTYTANAESLGTRGTRKSLTTAGSRSSGYGLRTSDSRLSRPIYGSYGLKQATDSHPQISNMTSSGLMNAIKSAPCDQTFDQTRKDALSHASLGESRIQPPKGYFFRDHHSNFAEPNPSLATENQKKSNEIGQASGRTYGGSLIGPNFSMHNAESKRRHPDDPRGNNSYQEYEEETLMSNNSDSSLSSFESAATKGKQYYDRVLFKRPMENYADGDHFQERDNDLGEEYSALESQSLFQSLKFMAVYSYQVVTSVAFFILVTAVMWSGSAIMFDVVPFPTNLRNSLKGMISYREPEPKHPMIVWIDKIFRLLRKITGFI